MLAFLLRSSFPVFFNVSRNKIIGFIYILFKKKIPVFMASSYLKLNTDMNICNTKLTEMQILTLCYISVSIYSEVNERFWIAHWILVACSAIYLTAWVLKSSLNNVVSDPVVIKCIFRFKLSS